MVTTVVMRFPVIEIDLIAWTPLTVGKGKWTPAYFRLLNVRSGLRHTCTSMTKQVRGQDLIGVHMTRKLKCGDPSTSTLTTHQPQVCSNVIANSTQDFNGAILICFKKEVPDRESEL